MQECNTASHTRLRELVEDLPGVKGRAWVVMAPSDILFPYYAFYQPVLGRATASKVNKFEGMPLSSYTLEMWGGGILQFLEEDSR